MKEDWKDIWSHPTSFTDGLQKGWLRANIIFLPIVLPICIWSSGHHRGWW